jgi:hypothetical protein
MITLDLNDGVKVNYGKFGNLLAEVKAVTGGAGDALLVAPKIQRCCKRRGAIEISTTRPA